MYARVRRSPQVTAQIHKDAGSPQRSSDRSQLAFKYSAQVLVDKIHGHCRRPQRVSAWMALEAHFRAPANLNLNWKQTVVMLLPIVQMLCDVMNTHENPK